MATIATQFRQALGNIEPSADADHAQDAHTRVSDTLTADQRLKDLGANPVLIGSYARQVSIRRVKDVDVFIRLEEADESLRPGAILNHVCDLLEKEFPGATERQYRSVKVDFDKVPEVEYDLSVDAVIARPCGDHWEIPQKIEDTAAHGG